MDLNLTGKAVIVTGARRGIGEATTKLLVSEGAFVVAVDRDPLPDEPRSDNILSVTLDLTSSGAAEHVVDAAITRFGRIDGLVNCVGAVQLYPGFLDIPEDAWLASHDLNFHVARRLTRAVIPVMLRQGGGSMVHVTTESARYPEPVESHYSTAKAALLNLSKVLAAEFTPKGIRSNVVSPGPTRTWLYDAPGGLADQAASMLGTDREDAITQIVTSLRPLMTRRIGTPSEVATVIAVLLSPITSQVTGSDWPVDGGALRQI